MAARGLGKGLDALIPNTVDKSGTKSKGDNKNNGKDESDKLIKITMIEPNREQPRKNFDEDSLLELAESIKQFGLLQPILVQDKGTYYEIIAGERRWRAAKLAGLKEVPVIIRNLTEQEIVEISLIENIQREDLNPIEEALAYKRLLTEFNLKQDEVAERVSKSRTAVTNSIRLLKLCDEVQQMIIDDMITTGHARALISIEDPEKQYMIAQKIFDEKLSVRNSGTIDEYVRVRIYKYWTRKVGENSSEKVTTLSPSLIKLNLVNEGQWIKNPDDVQAIANGGEKECMELYYKGILPSGSETAVFADSIMIDGQVAADAEIIRDGKTIKTVYKYDGVEFHVDVEVDAVQTHNAQDAIMSAWGVNAAEMGIL